MKDQVSEAELNVWANLFYMLVGIIRDKPAPVSLVGNACSLFLHLAWVMDRDLVFRGKGKCCPDARIGKSPLTISVKRDFDLNCTLDSLRVTTCCLCPLLDRWKQLIPVKFNSFPRGRD